MSRTRYAGARPLTSQSITVSVTPIDPCRAKVAEVLALWTVQRCEDSTSSILLETDGAFLRRECQRLNWKAHKPGCGQALSSIRDVPLSAYASNEQGCRTGLVVQLRQIEAENLKRPGTIWIVGDVVVRVKASTPMYTHLLSLRNAAVKASKNLVEGSDAGLLEAYTFFITFRRVYERKVRGLPPWIGAVDDHEESGELAPPGPVTWLNYWIPAEQSLQAAFELSEKSLDRMRQVGANSLGIQLV
ncbi:hypothetical protein P7C70_g1677, partial [Phenoliferia sp. Uapishka_3]